MTLTIREPKPGRRVISNNGTPVADIITAAGGGSFYVTMFGKTPGGMGKNVDDISEAKELVRAAVGA